MAHDNMYFAKQDFRHISKFDRNRKFLIISLLAVLFIVSLIVGGFLSGKNNKLSPDNPSDKTQKQLDPQSLPTQMPSTTLLIDPPSGSLSPTKPTRVAVMLDGVPSTSVDIVLIYEPTLMALSNLTNGDLFPNVITSQIKEDTLNYSASTSLEDPQRVGTGKVFSFTVTPKKAAQGSEVSLHFNPTGTITAVDGENTLGTTTGAVYKVE